MGRLVLRTQQRGLFYTTFRNLCSERSLSGRGLSLKVCGQLVHDTSPT